MRMAGHLGHTLRFIDELSDMRVGSGQQERGTRKKAGIYLHPLRSGNLAIVWPRSQELAPATLFKVLEVYLLVGSGDHTRCVTPYVSRLLAPTERCAFRMLSCPGIG